MGYTVYVRNKKTTAHQKGIWPEAKRIEVCTLLLSLGSVTETSKMTGIPINTIYQWQKADWWKELQRKIRQDEEGVLDAKLSKLIDKSLEKLMDSIENGEHVYDQKTGKIKRMPAKLRDINNAFNTILDKRQLIRKQPTKIIEQQSTANQLQNLADQFAKFVGKEIVDRSEVIPYEDVELQEDGSYALHDQRQEGLQEGTELGTHQEEVQSEG